MYMFQQFPSLPPVVCCGFMRLLPPLSRRRKFVRFGALTRSCGGIACDMYHLLMNEPLTRFPIDISRTTLYSTLFCKQTISDGLGREFVGVFSFDQIHLAENSFHGGRRVWKCGQARHKVGQQLVLCCVEAIFDVPQGMPKLWYTDISIDNGVVQPEKAPLITKVSNRSSGMSMENATVMSKIKGGDRSASWA